MPAVLTLVALAVFSSQCNAFNPPVDKAGPLTVRIEGPALVKQKDAPVPLRVVLENKSDRPIEGTLTLHGIDQWQVAPSEAVSFTAPANGQAAYDFTMTTGGKTYNALYPIHAYAKFALDGAEQTAHPILIFKTMFPDSAADRPAQQASGEGTHSSEPNRVAAEMRAEPAFPPQDDGGSYVLGQIERKDESYEVRVWPGSRGLLNSIVGFQHGGKQLFFRGFEVSVAGHRLDDPNSSAVLREAKEEPCEQGRRFRHRFDSPAGGFDLVENLWIERSALRARFQLEHAPEPKPWSVVRIENVAIGSWSRTAMAAYAGHGNVIRRPGAFRLSYDGHMMSTSFVGFDFEDAFSMVQGVDVPPALLHTDPAKRHYSLHSPHSQTMTLIPADNVWEAAKTWHDVNGLKAAGGVKKLAGRFNFDIWGGKYDEACDSLQRAFHYGLTNSIVVWHNWQRWGYDYRLPEVFPPNPEHGDPKDFAAMSRLCKEHGVLWAPHDNYIDFYPDAEGFSYEKTISFLANGQPSTAWMHFARNAQSYRFRTSAIEPFMQKNLRLIRDYLQPEAYFIDCWANLSPFDSWTNQGEFVDRVETRDTWRRSFAWVREFLGNDAPTISESGNDGLIGWLDGAQTNHLRVGNRKSGPESWCVWNWQCEDAERIPWTDTANHDRFVLLGAGYPGRYEAGLDSHTHGIYSDDYISTEVLTGHPGMVPHLFGRDVVRKYWLINDLMRALALHRIEGVEFDGGVGGNLHRQHVRWDNGDVWVNRGESDWEIAGQVLPQYGFYAKVSGKEGPVEASITRRDGVVVEMSRSANFWYVHGRRHDANPQGEKKEAASQTVDFGPIATIGGCRVTLEGKAILVTPLPGAGLPTFNVQIRPESLPWFLPSFTAVESLDEERHVIAREPAHRNGNAIELSCKPEVFAYRLVEK